MPDASNKRKAERESVFLNEYLMATACGLTVAVGLVALCFRLIDGDMFKSFELLVKLVAAAAMFMAFKFYKWDVAKGLMGGVLFCLMYQEAHLVLATLWGEQDFDVYLMVGVQGSIYLAAAGMTFLMTIIITINHFFISYSFYGNPKNAMFNRIALASKFVTYIILLVANSQLGFSDDILWRNALPYVSDACLLVLLICVESQFDSFNVIRRELREARRKTKGQGK